MLKYGFPSLIGISLGLAEGIGVCITAPPEKEVVDEPTQCRYWNVLTPASELGDTFWIGGWVEECDGLLSPVITFLDTESPEERVLRAENVIVAQGTELTKLRERVRMLEESNEE